MQAEINISLTFQQILSLVKQLSIEQKLNLTKELEKEGINSRLSNILNAFRIEELSEEVIDQEVEIVRQQLYEQSKKH